MAISEAQLILPSLYAMSIQNDGSISTSQLIKELRSFLKPSGDDLAGLKNRKDDKFSQIVRNLVSHSTLERLGYAKYSKGTFTINEAGLNYINEPDNRLYIEENFAEEFEGAETVDNVSGDTNDEYEEEENLDKTYQYQPNLVNNSSLNIGKDQFSVFELKRKKEKHKLILDPDFQRKNVWSSFQKSELVESILMNIPLPFIYLTEDKKGNLIVVDGRQRLTALFEFMDNKFRLSRKLKILKDIAGHKFSELEPLMQGTIEDYQLTTHIIKPPTSDRILIDIFDRVNRSGTILNNQEIRNALYQGRSTNLLKELAESSPFKNATDSSIKPDRMKDRYLILRFLSFYLWRTEFVAKGNTALFDYKGDTEDFLPKYMQYINSMVEDQILNLKNIFYKAMENAISILGQEAFRLHNKKDNKKRPINMALFESLSYALSNDKVSKNKEAFFENYQNLLNDPDFIKSFLSIDSTVKYRFDVMDKLLLSLD